MKYLVILAHLKIFKITFFGQGDVKVKQINQNVCSVIYHNYAKYK